MIIERRLVSNHFTRGRRWFLGTARLIVALLLPGGLSAPAAVRLPHIFGNHMVLQKGRPIPVWGTAAPGAKITVRLGNDSATAVADSAGRWKVVLPARQKPAVGQRLVVRSRNGEASFSDVAVGEVWLCSGQSNMEMGIQRVRNAAEEIRAANFPQIRLFDVPKVLAATPQNDCGGNWVRCSPETVKTHGTWGGFSACAYFFGRALFRRLHCPIGLIDSSWGGSRIEPWTPPVGFRAVASLADIARRIELADPATPAHKKLMQNTLDAFQEWLAAARGALKQGNDPPPQPPFPKQLEPLSGWADPCTMYNAMIHPLIPFALRGVIWYQGESNRGDGMRYVDKTRAQVQGWRTLWHYPDLPYYYVQIAPYQYGNEDPEVLPRFWEAQAAIEKQIPHTGMAVINDIGNLRDIHPKNKQEVGRRLALLALAETYGQTGIVCRGPLFQRMEIVKNTIRVYFANAAGGLTTRDGKAPDNFEMLGDNGDFVPADARIEGAVVVLSSPKIRTPYAVRFAWNKLAVPNLMNRAGLPAAAFRAGHVPIRALLDSRAPEAKAYRLLYVLELPDVTMKGNAISYALDRSADFRGKRFDRIAYFLYLQPKHGSPRYVFVSMKAFSRDLRKIGVPTYASGARFQQPIQDMEVVSNLPGLKTGRHLTGNIEFWAANYGPGNSARVPGASETAYDFGDSPRPGVPNGYGSMQIHNPTARQTVFAYNHWTAGARADLGIGNSPKGNPDWTFRHNAGEYAMARLLVLIHLEPEHPRGK